MSSVSEENANDGAQDMDLDFEQGVNETVFGDPEIARGGTPTPPVPKAKKARKAAAPRVKKAAPAKEGKRPKSKKAALALLDSVADQLTAQDTEQKKQDQAGVDTPEATAPTEEAKTEPEAPPKKVDRRRGKITDPVKLAARREQLNKMREKALAARSANAKRARELKEAAAWKKKQDEEALLAAFNSHISGLSEPQVDTQTKKYSRAAAIKRHKAAAAAAAEPADKAEDEDEPLPTPPPLPCQTSAAASPKAATAEKRVEPSPFGGYYAAPTGWNVNPTGKPVSRFARNPNVYF